MYLVKKLVRGRRQEKGIAVFGSIKSRGEQGTVLHTYTHHTYTYTTHIHTPCNIHIPHTYTHHTYITYIYTHITHHTPHTYTYITYTTPHITHTHTYFHWFHKLFEIICLMGSLLFLRKV